MSIAKYVGAIAAAVVVAGPASAQYGPNGQYPVGPQPVYPSVFSSTPYLPPVYGTPSYTYPGTVRTGGFARSTYYGVYNNNRGFNNNGYYGRSYGSNYGGGRRGWYR